MNNLYSIIDQSRNYPTQHPGSRECSDNQQNNQGRAYPRNIIYNGMFYIFPGDMVSDHAYSGTKRRCHQQTDLTATSQSISSKQTDREKQ